MKRNTPKRNTTLDGARGLALSLMTLNHFVLLILPLSGLIQHFGDALGFFSMAEVFFFLAGFSVFLAYFDDTSPYFDPASRQVSLVKRVGILCIAEVWMLLGYYGATGRIPFNSAAFSANTPPGTSFLPLGLDILPVHILILSIIALAYPKLRRTNIQTLLCVSVAIWAVGWASGSLLRLSSPYHPLFSALYFNPFAAQLMYTLGFALAVCLREQKFQSAHPQLNSLAFGACMLLVVGSFYVLRHQSIFDLTPLAALTSRRDFGPLRLINFVGICGLLFWLSFRFPLEKLIKPFHLLGYHCLWLFACSTVGLYALQSYLSAPVGHIEISQPFPITTTQIFAAITFIFLAIRNLD